MKKKVTLLIPAYNEEDSVPELLQEVINQNISKSYSLEVIIVDDGSSDNTYNNSLEFAEKNKNTSIKYKIVKLLRNVGKSAALNAGIDNMSGDYLVLMDADLQDDPKYIEQFIMKIEQGLDLVVGNRINRYQDNKTKYLSSHLANWVMRSTTGDVFHDMNCGFKIMTKEVAYSLGLKKGYHRYIPLISSIRGFNGGELEIKQRARIHGDSKYGKTGLIRMVRSTLDMISIVFVYKFREKPFDIFGRAGIFLFAVGTLILIYLTIGWFFGRYILGRPLYFMGILFVIVGINTISLGLLGELITDRGGKTKSYIIKENYE